MDLILFVALNLEIKYESGARPGNIENQGVTYSYLQVKLSIDEKANSFNFMH